MVVLMVALFVLGPERLPPLVRQAGRWLGELKRLRESVESEVKGVLDELPRPNVSGHAGGNPLAGMESPFSGLHDSVSSIGNSLRSVLGTGSAAVSTAGQGGANGSGPPYGRSGPTADRAGEDPVGPATTGREVARSEAIPADPSLN